VTDGLLVVDKPPGMTSHDVVARCRRVFGQKRIGHGGTLDPDATGVLVVGLGTVTRLLRFLSELPKCYEAEVVLGVSTTTLDAAGEVTGRWDMSGVTLDQVKDAARLLTGEIEQVPPMVSALKVGGQRLHRLARAGVEVERRARPVTVSRFDVEWADGADGQVLAISVECSAGTYVRVLAADLGAALGGGAHLRQLRRTAVGPWRECAAVPLDDVGPDRVLPPAEALPWLERVEVSPEVARAVGHGKVISTGDLATAGPGPWRVVGRDGRLLAVYESRAPGLAGPAVVLP
jgi:tRNA pseudouridine55 synthase